MTNADFATVGTRAHDDAGVDRLSLLVPRNVWIDGHRTSVKLEPEIWDALRKIANHQGLSVHELVSGIDHSRPTRNLTSAVRAYVVNYLATALDWAKA